MSGFTRHDQVLSPAVTISDAMPLPLRLLRASARASFLFFFIALALFLLTGVAAKGSLSRSPLRCAWLVSLDRSASLPG
jgi:hypothetical protein